MGLNFKAEKMPRFMEMSLSDISNSHTLRCDAKQSEIRFKQYQKLINSTTHIELGHFLPNTIIKGSQPKYLEELDAVGIPVINTLSIQNLKINSSDCRYISEEDFERLDENRKLKDGDVLLSVDGGTSIGKAALFTFRDEFTIDSHIAILRPEGINPITLVYLLASPLGQLQFNKAESGASGQTGVSEDDIRRFKFPIKNINLLEKAAAEMNVFRLDIEKKKLELDNKLSEAWRSFGDNLIK